MTVDGNELNVSLEPHLVERLVPLIQVLPPELAVTLRPYTIEPTPSIIPYSLLVSISQWSRSTPGQTTLHSQVPALNAQDYTMISLLAGSITSPERHFPVHVPKSILAEEERKRQLTDKKAIVTLLNAFLSILGSGVAAWLVAERWRHEWRVLLSFLTAVTVAASETILYIIWQSRRSRQQESHTLRFKPTLHKKTDGSREQPEGDADRLKSPRGDQAIGGNAAGLRYRAKPEHTYSK